MAVTKSNSLSYIASYADLCEAFGVNVDAGYQHYVAFGQSEGRTITFDGLAYIASSPPPPSMPLSLVWLLVAHQAPLQCSGT